MLAEPARQKETERTDTVLTTESPIFLNIRNMPIAAKCTTFLPFRATDMREIEALSAFLRGLTLQCFHS